MKFIIDEMIRDLENLLSLSYTEGEA